jgi:transcriptional regulator with XRE-family HTH domain
VADLRLKKLRTAKKLTQADVAAHLQIARESYSRYESGEREMTYDALISLADLFSVSVDYLFGRYDTNPVVLRDNEISLLNMYRAVDERGQHSIYALAEHEYSHVPKDKDTRKSVI